MERYNVPEHGYSDSYLIHGTGSNPQLTSSLVEQFEAMYNEGNPELLVDQGLYYPTATNYGYICTGFESPGDWDEHQRFLGQDGQDIQYAGAQTESLPCVYYTPSYGYAQSPYNPYNPYIPGAMLGIDGPLVGTQQYYTIPSYETPVPSPAYFPMAVQPRPDLISNASRDSFLDTTASTGSHFKNNLSPAAPTFLLTPPRPASNKATLARVSEGIEANAGSSRQSTAHANITSASLSSPAKSQVHLGKGSHALDNNVLDGKAMSSRDQLKVVIPSDVGGVCLPNYGSNASGRGTLDKPRFYYNRVSNDANEGPDALVELNRGPRTNKLKDHLTVKAYTTKAGDTDERGNIIIYTDQYNRDDIATDYVNAKFFVIKSYSEDDVHKSVKYNVWSSTPNGNKKLNSAYEDAQRIASGESKSCPVFLFFSVNASGQFCGVAEMHGPVNFHRDMDFWQQDKWSGSFNVKWHIIKDVPNPNFRHILLENNENKPVTNSRDTQEIRYKKGMDMLKIFKNYISKTSLLDDFMYYEKQQKMLQEEKARLLFNTLQGPLIASVIDSPERNSVLDAAANVDMKNVDSKDMSKSKENVGSALSEQVPKNLVINNADIANAKAADDIENGKTNEDIMRKIGLPTIKPKQSESNLSEASTTVSVKEGFGEAVDVVTVGSMPIKVDGFGQSLGFLTVGTIPLDPRSLGLDGIGGFSKAESHKG